MKRMQNAVGVFSALVLSFSLLVTPSTLRATDNCHDCCILASQNCFTAKCLLGCPVEEPDCEGLRDCQEAGDECWGTGYCDPWPGGDLLLASGQIGSVVQSIRESAINFVEEDGSITSRRKCDAAVIAVRYSTRAVERILEVTNNIAI